MDPGAIQRFININIAQTGDQVLIEKGVLDLAGTASEADRRAIRQSGAGERFGSQLAIEEVDRVFIGKDDATELALVAEAKICAIGEVDGEMLEADRWRGGWEQERGQSSEGGQSARRSPSRRRRRYLPRRAVPVMVEPGRGPAGSTPGRVEVSTLGKSRRETPDDGLADHFRDAGCGERFRLLVALAYCASTCARGDGMRTQIDRARGGRRMKTRHRNAYFARSWQGICDRVPARVGSGGGVQRFGADGEAITC